MRKKLLQLCWVPVLVPLFICAQDKREINASRSAWIDFHFTSLILNKEIPVSEGLPGWGGGFSLLFNVSRDLPSKQAPIFLGFSFDQQYLGTKMVDPYNVHYENYQFHFTTRFTNTTATNFKPFFDLSLGGRYTVALTTEHAYSTVVFLRALEIAAAVSNTSANFYIEHRIQNEYGNLGFQGGLSIGLMLPTKDDWRGPTFRASIFYGTPLRYLDCTQIKTADDLNHYTFREGSPLMFSLQAGISL